jgi:tripartite-type tricarboxylate transporter receptor subunit TctC
MLSAIPHLLALLVLALPLAATAQIQAGRPIRVINPYPAGASSDVMARVFAERVSTALGSPVLVDNRPGAGGTIGVDIVARSPADGHTVLFVNSGPVVLIPLLQKTPYDPQKDLAPVTQVATNVMVLVVHASTAQSLRELVEQARARPGQLSYASIGNGSLLHIAGETLKKLAGIDLVHVPYKGTVPAVTDVLSRQVSMAFSDLVATRAHIDAGTLRALGISGTRRWAAFPDVPLFGEVGYAPLDRFIGWWGVFVPPGTPKPAVDQLARAFNDALRQPDTRKRIADANADPTGTSPAEFSDIVRADLARWSALLKELGNIRMD